MQNKQQEFLKQRERLKYVTANNISKKALDPDVMIEQLISDKETFKFNLQPPLPYTLPKWLKVQNNLVPAVYEQVWQAVKLGPVFQYCDTKIITHLFTTSGLSLDKLGYLWSLTNVSSPGFLTQQELYVMLALIALVQTGYQVKDILILKNINHPILPQLDYTFLNITVANPAINRSLVKNTNADKETNNITCNGFGSSSFHEEFNSKYPYQNSIENNCTRITEHVPSNPSVSQLQPNLESRFSNLSVNPIAQLRKSEIDVIFAIPDKKLNPDADFCDGKSVSELDVDFPIPISTSSSTSNFAFEYQKSDTCATNIPETEKSDANTFSKNFSALPQSNSGFLGMHHFSNNLEPRSLDLPVFGENDGTVEDDEFTEFQSATLPVTDEYSDFQSASPIVKYEVDILNSEDLLQADVATQSSCSKTVLEDSINEDLGSHKTSIEADKYDVFRTLMEPEKEEKPQITKIKNDDDDGDNDDYDEEERDEDDFGEFYVADIKPEQNKENVSVKEKCLIACLRILQEGSRIFSSIPNEQTIREVLSNERGYRYFNQLKIVYDTSQRFQRKFENTHLNDALQSTWAKLSIYAKYIPNDELLDEISAEEDKDASPCKLCETKCDINCVRYAGNNYHVTCINLFLHFVEDLEITSMLNI